MKDLWLLDLDGTLVDTSGDIARAMNYVLSGLGLEEMEPDAIMRHVGQGTPLLIASILRLDPAHPSVDRAAALFVENYSTAPASRSRLYPAAAETLEALAGSARIAVVSNKDSRLVRATVDATGLTRWVERVWGGGDDVRLKPAPDMILAAMGEMGVPASRTTMLGDMGIDVAAGRAAGVRTLFASWGFGTLGPGDPLPDGRLSEFREILEWIR